LSDQGNPLLAAGPRTPPLRGDATSDPNNPLLVAAREPEFRRWYSKIADKLGINPNPDDPEHYYDYRAFYGDMLQGKAEAPDAWGGHFTSKYKLPGHPRTYLDDGQGRIFDTRSGQYLNGDTVSNENLTASERSPDMPGFDPQQALTKLMQARGGR